MRSIRLFGSVALLCLMSASALAGGFEKAVMTSAKYGGVGGAAAASVNDAESLYFNPAGLAAIDGLTATVNFDPTFSKFEGPILTGIVGGTPTVNNASSNTTFSPVFSATVATKPIDKLGVGLGVYVAGGTKAIYEGVPLPASTTETAKVSSEVSITEIAAGAGYELMEGLSVGGTWRVSFVNAALSSIAPSLASHLATTVVAIDNISATKFTGFRLGARYAPRNMPFGFGAFWRSQVTFNGTGDASIKTATGTVVGATQKATISNTFPHQVSVGGYYDVMPKQLRVLGEWTWSQYNRDHALPISFENGTGSAIPQNWKNQSNFRVGSEYYLSDWTVRGGYVYTTGVTPKTDARATFSSPGTGHTVTLGGGTKFMGGLVGVNVAGEYSWAAGSVGAGDAGITIPQGDYKSHAYVAHLGATFAL